MHYSLLTEQQPEKDKMSINYMDKHQIKGPSFSASHSPGPSCSKANIIST